MLPLVFIDEHVVVDFCSDVFLGLIECLQFLGGKAHKDKGQKNVSNEIFFAELVVSVAEIGKRLSVDFTLR